MFNLNNYKYNQYQKQQIIEFKYKNNHKIQLLKEILKCLFFKFQQKLQKEVLLDFKNKYVNFVYGLVNNKDKMYIV